MSHGGHLDSGRSILGVIYQEPIGLQWALDGELPPVEDPEALSAFEWEEVEAVWIHGVDEDLSTVRHRDRDLVTRWFDHQIHPSPPVRPSAPCWWLANLVSLHRQDRPGP